MFVFTGRKIAFVSLLCFIPAVVFGYVENPGPKYVATVGHPWPLPKSWTKSDSVYSVNSSIIFRVVDQTCDILEDAMRRYTDLIHRMNRHQRQRSNRRTKKQKSTSSDAIGNISTLSVHLEQPCEERPFYGMSETYELTIDDHPLLISSSIWGILRGLETFSQLIHRTSSRGPLQVNKTSIVDAPRFSHRGLLVDTSRHFIQPILLKKILDGMSYNKLNVFHWHIVDDQSFPYVSKTFPELSEKGAYDRAMVYSQDTVKEIIEYARLRGIRVMIEFDTPGHTRAIGQSHPEVLTQCYAQYAGKLGPVDPTKNSTYDFMQKMFEELVEVFPDEFIHLGADEVGYECWETNPAIRRYMQEKGYRHFNELQSEYIEKIHEIVNQLNATSIVWQEAFQSGLKLKSDTVVHAWIGNGMDVMSLATRAGYRVLLSSGWYLDHLSFASDFLNMYNNEPTNFYGTAAQKALVIGGEACMWSEMVDDNSIMTRIFPRVGAAAERLWSSTFNETYALHRIEEHSCRLKRRGIPTQPPNGPGFCVL